jgi:hypothetical protein
VPQLSRRKRLPWCVSATCCCAAALAAPDPAELRRGVARPDPTREESLCCSCSGSASCRAAIVPQVAAVGLFSVLPHLGPSRLGVRTGTLGDVGLAVELLSADAGPTLLSKGGALIAKLGSDPAPGKPPPPDEVSGIVPELLLLLRRRLVRGKPPPPPTSCMCATGCAAALAPLHASGPAPAGVPGSDAAGGLPWCDSSRSRELPLPPSIDRRRPRPTAAAAEAAAAPAAASAASAIGPTSLPLLGALLMLLPGADGARELPPRQLPVGVPGASE